MSKQSEFLKEFFFRKGIRQRTLCEQLGVSPATISNTLRGHVAVSKSLACKLNELYGLSIGFLLLGEDEPFGCAEQSVDDDLYKITISGGFITTMRIRAKDKAEAARIAKERLMRGEYQDNSIIFSEDSLITT